MTGQLDKFKEFMTKFALARQAPNENGVYSPKLEERVNARAILNNLANEAGMPALNYEDEQGIVRYANLARSKYKDEAVNYFDSNSVGIIGGVEDSKLVELAFSIEPVESAKKKEIVEKHKRALKLTKLLQAAKTEDEENRVNYQEIIDEVLLEVEKNIDEQYSKNTPGSDKPYSEETKELAKKAAKYVIQHRKEAGLYALSVLTAKAQKEFNDSFRDDKEKAVYARENIEKYAHKGDDEKLNVMELLYREG